jgi:preprotein translocase subunit SecA
VKLLRLNSIVEKLIGGSYSKRALKKIYPIADKIEAFSENFKRFSDDEMRAKTAELKKRLFGDETLDDILPEAFALVGEAAHRVLGMRPFYVQYVGGIVLHQGRIAEMKTGEGKTLVATLPAFLNALTGRGVHIVTVNDYLAKRDSEWMGKIYLFLGLTVGVVEHDLKDDARRAAYSCDITYVTNNELGFDYLRDNMVAHKTHRVQRGHYFCIIDEVDSILIDEARTPLIISGQGDKSTELYRVADSFAADLSYKTVSETDTSEDFDILYADCDCVIDEKAKTTILTGLGVKKAEEAFGVENLADNENAEISHHINQAIKARGNMRRDIDNVVKDEKVIIVDEFTGRLMHGRRYNDGLHQAIEAKEGVKVENESKTLATITFQNFFRIYEKLSGMTGTAQTEEVEFQEIYHLDVVVIPTNKPLIRKDLPDVVYKTEEVKFNAVADEIARIHETGQPVLIGTISIEKSENLSEILKSRGIAHNVLNAKFHEKEAEIIAQAGRKGAVTIATNMAGRGTDIMLGGNAEFMAKTEMRRRGYSLDMISLCSSFADTADEKIIEARIEYTDLIQKFKNENQPEQDEVLELGGLFIIGTERHDSRRIDNQLRGRSGRQGDAGSSRFYLSLEDSLMRLFGAEKITKVMNFLKIDEAEPIESKMVSGAIEGAQKRVESHNFDVRKHVLQFDDVNNQQREIIYKQRNQVLDGESVRGYIYSMFESVAGKIISLFASDAKEPIKWNMAGVYEYFASVFTPAEIGELDFSDGEKNDKNFGAHKLKERIIALATEKYASQEELFGEKIRDVERIVLLRVVDEKWMDHIDAMEQLKQGIHLRGYAQHDPIVEYRFEGMEMFDEMIYAIKEDTVRFLFHARLGENESRRVILNAPPKESLAAKIASMAHGSEENVSREEIGRNDPCPCGSGKKFKNCCMNKED